MEITQKSKAIILKREEFLENNSRVFVYTQDFGKLDLVARGTGKISSKLSGHIEPLNLSEIMIIKGKQYDYLGSALCENSFTRIKNNYEKSFAAGGVVAVVDNIIRGKEKDERIFLMLKKFLEILNYDKVYNKEPLQVLQSTFILKLTSLLGYKPNLDSFIVGNMRVSEDIINIMKFALTKRFDEILEINFDSDLVNEFEKQVNKYKQYIFD